MPSIVLDPTDKGLFQQTGSGLFIKGSQAVVATADGLTTGLISATGGPLVLASGSDATHWITLPTPTEGLSFIINIAAVGCELRTSAPGSIAINGVTGSGKELALAVNSTVWCIATSATNWIVTSAAAATADT